MKLYEIIYVSTMAPATPVTAISRIVARAKQYNQANDITGMLVFDGLRFAQLLEGPLEVVLELIERIRADSRHTQMEVVHHAAVDERRFVRFSMGYVPTEHEDALAQLEQSDGPASMHRFLDLIPLLDLGH